MQPRDPLQPSIAACRTGAAKAGAPLCLDAAALFATGREVRIVHAGEVYLLRLTRQNKLILTK
ncbi:hemin uptake protein HemP [Sulfurisoma sediminicola]|uniref:Hemin uptake protein hemP n=1 Tax=Sulfurisoma sediminicola TaxID=1381557 RepID=A0A497XJG8_9PROT|nr:hemin uptake protein HemP [Sulfurisoma sediminicola]RLJ68061.1 hemin uptake protein hemP [Sulfurisoma sediminicola]